MSESLPWRIVLAAVLASGCSDHQAARMSASAPAETSKRLRLAPVRTLAGLTGRSVIELPSGPCIVLHYPPYEMLNDAESTEMADFVARVLAGDIHTTEDDGQLACDQVSRWCPGAGSETRVTQCTFNCCTFAVGDVVGLTTRDWIMGLACAETEHSCPMQVILNTYFEQIRCYRPGVIGFDWAGIEADPELLQDDVLCFVQTYEMNGSVTEIIHAGRIWKHQGRNWLISKMGVGPILLAPLDRVASSFEQAFDVVLVHRARTHTS